MSEYIDNNPQANHPYYWAPFVLVGNGKISLN